MPTICTFSGVVITMNYREHGPPHFHARYGEYRAVFGIDPVVALRGRLPPRLQSLVVEWAELRRAELADDWSLARSERALVRIAPPE